jgi:hypothetical protein
LTLFVPGLANAFDFKGLEIGAATTPAAVEEALAKVTDPLPPGLPESTRKFFDDVDKRTNLKCGGREPDSGLQWDGDRRRATGGREHRDLGDRTSPAHLAPLQVLRVRCRRERHARKKFGKPTSTNRGGVQSGAGADYEQIEHTLKDDKGNFVTLTRTTVAWTGPRFTLRAKRRSSS